MTEVNLQTKEQLPEFQTFRYAVFYFYLYFYFSKQKNIKMYHNNLRNKQLLNVHHYRRHIYHT